MTEKKRLKALKPTGRSYDKIIDRLARLFALFRERRAATMKEIAAELDVHPRQARRYLNAAERARLIILDEGEQDARGAKRWRLVEGWR